MSAFNTVGELIEQLKTFDPSTPVLIGDRDGSVYRDILLSEGLSFRVVPKGDGSEGLYEDADPRNPHSFDAVVL